MTIGAIVGGGAAASARERGVCAEARRSLLVLLRGDWRTIVSAPNCA